MKKTNKCRFKSIIVVILVISFLGNTQIFGKDIPPPFIHYSFDETTGNIAHNSGTGDEKLNAQVNGGKVNWVSGLFSGAVKLSDNGHFKLQDGVLENITDFTLSTWVYINEQAPNQTVCTFANGTEQYLILTTQRGNLENGVSLVMTNNSGKGNNHINKEERISYTTQKEPLSANAWHHLAFTLKGNVGTLYVDGIKAEVKTDFTTNPSKLGHTKDNYIGRPTWPDPYLNGMIDDFRIYDYALTDDQIFEVSAAADPILVQEDRDKLSLDNLSSVTSNLNLPSTGKSGSHITWSSNNKQLVSDNGVIHRPYAGSGDGTATLMASVTKGATTLTKEFSVTIRKISDSFDLDVFSMQTGNPTIPAYLADASFYYDKNTDTFYAYGTNDGAGGGNVYPTQVWYSKDCKTWKNEIVIFPKSWTDYAGTVAVWAPSIEYSPVTKKYYLMYSIAGKTFIGMSDHPLGPWEDANGMSPGNMFYIGYDGQLFVDDDNTVYIVTDAWHFKIMKMKSDATGKLYFDNDDPRFDKSDSNEFVGTYKYKQITEIKNAFEASLIYKKYGLYYLMWSFNGSENYNVRYAVSESITGPYREINNSMTEPILVRDDNNNILGPGHHSMFDYGDRTFIAYHRQHFPFVDSKRQTCIEEVLFNTDGSIQKITPTHRGVTVRNIEKDARKNIALGKQTMVSSTREYDSSAPSRRYRTYDISFRYSGNFAVDENYGTHWDAGIGAVNPWLIVDMGSECRVDEIETIFEFTSRTYKYKLEYLTQKEAKDLDSASKSNEWKTFVDKSLTGVEKSPVTDTTPNKKSVKARFVRLTISGADNLPPTADGADPINAENSLSIFEIKIFGEDKADDINRIFEAESYNNQYGLTFEKIGSTGLGMTNAQNNDFLMYKNIDFGKGTNTFTARVASGNEDGRLEVYLDSLIGEPVGVLEITNTEGKQNWETKSVKLKQKIEGTYNKVYLVFKGKIGEDNLFNLDWFKFENNK
jgi:hypothetical protein